MKGFSYCTGKTDHLVTFEYTEGSFPRTNTNFPSGERPTDAFRGLWLRFARSDVEQKDARRVFRLEAKFYARGERHLSGQL
jgi:hypothetical protein